MIFMKIGIVSKNKRHIRKIKEILDRNNVQYSSKKPDIVISLGGDGTYLASERMFSGIPKLMIRDDVFLDEHNKMFLDWVFEKLKKKQFSIRENIKLDVSVGIKDKTEKITCTNDVVIRNKLPTYAIRFSIEVNDKLIYDEVIGDGVVVSTPFGSTGYFHSITKKSFDKGIGVAINNPTRDYKHLFLEESSKVKVKILRGKAHVSVDNNPKIFIIGGGDKVAVKKSKHLAKIVQIKPDKTKMSNSLLKILSKKYI